MHPYKSTWLKAHRELVKTADGVKIDFSSGIFSNSLGHNNKFIAAAILKQLKLGFTNTYRHPTAIREQYIEKLKGFTGAYQVFLFSTGAEACEAARRMMIANGDGSYNLCKMRDGFHGRTRGVIDDGYMNILDHPRAQLRKGEYMEIQNRSQSAGLFLEPYRPYDASWYPEIWLQLVRAEFRQIAMDEIQAGFYRTGREFGFYHYKNFYPDYIILGKAIANGYPLSAVCVLREDWIFTEDEYTSTYGGNPLACAAGLAALELYRAQQQEIIDMAKKFEQRIFGLHELAQGKGACMAVKCNNEEATVEACFNRGLIVIPTGKGWIKLAPPLTSRENYLLKGIKILKGVLDEDKTYRDPDETSGSDDLPF